MILKIFAFTLVATSLCACTKSTSTPVQNNSSKSLIPFEMSSVDEQIQTDFKSLKNPWVHLEKGKKIALSDFLRTVKEQLLCPTHCEAFSYCEKDEKEQTIENCQIQWSKKIEQQKNQDAEPGSIWTLEYQKIGGKVTEATLTATWKDF